MKAVYPILINECDNNFLVTVPDWNIFTEGNSLYDAIIMGRDAISLLAVDLEDKGKSLPESSDYATAMNKALQADGIDEVDYNSSITTYVDIDTEEYRKVLETLEINDD